MLRIADRVVVASLRDGEHLGWSDRMSVLPNGVDTAYWSRRSTRRPDGTVIFTGKMSYAPNEDAAMRLIEEVWPSVRARRPDARLMIVGTSPGPRLVEAGSLSGVTVTGRVDDMRDYLDDATVFAAPIRHGAGIQNKLLEALAMQLPVVASTNATDGLVLDGGDPPVHVTDDLATMADLIVDELNAARSDPAPRHAHRTWVADRFDWGVSAGRIDAILQELCSHGPAERNP
jgi:glycosyltransferase involved in cell wall biosynthesis